MQLNHQTRFRMKDQSQIPQPYNCYMMHKRGCIYSYWSKWCHLDSQIHSISSHFIPPSIKHQSSHYQLSQTIQTYTKSTNQNSFNLREGGEWSSLKEEYLKYRIRERTRVKQQKEGWQSDQQVIRSIDRHIPFSWRILSLII